MDITVIVKIKGGLSKTFEAHSNRYLDYTKWFKVAVRIQDSESLLRVFVDDQMVLLDSFKYQFSTYPKDAELRLAQDYEIQDENTGPQIKNRFKVSCRKTIMLTTALSPRARTPLLPSLSTPATQANWYSIVGRRGEGVLPPPPFFLSFQFSRGQNAEKALRSYRNACYRRRLPTTNVDKRTNQ